MPRGVLACGTSRAIAYGRTPNSRATHVMKIAIYVTTANTSAATAIRSVLGLSPHVAKQTLEIGGVLFECRVPAGATMRRQVLELLAIVDYYQLDPIINVLDDDAPTATPQQGRRITAAEARAAL